MITAAEARKRTTKNLKEPKWNILDSIQFKFIESKIKFWSGFGRDYIILDFIVPRPLVRNKLEKNGFEFAVFGVARTGFTWRKEEN